MTKFANMVRAFAREQDGIALTEYLILLGLFTAAVITAVGLAGADLAAAWDSWGSFFSLTASCQSDSVISC